ncbi:cytochrome c551 [Lentibacillus amyloliquefaciens]|uniref:Cytochrome C551 n=1 Tax=Lentibacillus amyloliquefaciens TaxID=1472767 RepID=A0A0U4EAM6_9BACI|nr:cytochrome c [Lentibacillus amyloliquefaciens]ALX50348.1 cytochrome C551 [Lentibacillus amyloliquefaciens]
MKKWLLTMLFATALMLGACGGGGDSGGESTGGDEGGSTTDSAAAEEIFESNCASCHGADLSGGNGPDLTAVGADYSSDEIADIIQNGKGSMPAQENVSEGDAQTLADWLAEKK